MRGLIIELEKLLYINDKTLTCWANSINKLLSSLSEGLSSMYEICRFSSFSALNTISLKQNYLKSISWYLPLINKIDYFPGWVDIAQASRPQLLHEQIGPLLQFLTEYRVNKKRKNYADLDCSCLSRIQCITPLW